MIRALLFAFFCIPALIMAAIFSTTGDKPVDGHFAALIAFLNFAGGMTFYRLIDSLRPSVASGVADAADAALIDCQKELRDGTCVNDDNLFLASLAIQGYEIRRL